jgi:hypothetical protein
MKDSTLLLSVAAFLLIDVVINAAWAGAGLMKSTIVVVDPYRPFYNYTVCDFNDAAGAIYAHIAVKGFILFCGVILTYAVKNTPSQVSIVATRFVVVVVVGAFIAHSLSSWLSLLLVQRVDFDRSFDLQRLIRCLFYSPDRRGRCGRPRGHLFYPNF